MRVRVLFFGILKDAAGRSAEESEWAEGTDLAAIYASYAGRYPRSRDMAGRIAVVHRLGRLLVGETSVVVVVTAPHRKPAFDAALEAINRLKKTVPIWKKELFVDGELWVEGEWDRDVPVAR